MRSQTTVFAEFGRFSLSASGPDPGHLADLGRAVRELRVRQAVSIPDLAACLGTDAETISALECCLLDPTYELLLDLADCLDIRAAELFACATGWSDKRGPIGGR
jgi:ribosome-binding protein aMBF1 (putative translation factor)